MAKIGCNRSQPHAYFRRCTWLARRNVGPVELTEGTGLLSGIVDLFEEGVAAGKDVLKVTGGDVAVLCDDLIKDSKTYADHCQESVGKEVTQALKKYKDKAK